ncbi:MAG: PLP-dependent transferase [Pseudomonas sp.]|nr:PLP-dependent transferase [Pseudomonas sp.]
MKLETRAIHAGHSLDPTTRAVAVPIYQTMSYAVDSTQHSACVFNIYSRIMNPTNDLPHLPMASC